MGGKEQGIQPARQKPVTPIRSPLASGMLLYISYDGIQIGYDPAVRNRVDHLTDSLDIGQIQDAPLPGIRLEGNAQEALLRKAAGDILDVFVHPKNFRNDQNNGIFSCSSGSRLVDRDLKIAGGDPPVSHSKPSVGV